MSGYNGQLSAGASSAYRNETPMITASALRAQQPARWQQLWRESITDANELLAVLGLTEQAGDLLPADDAGFALRVPRGFVARMRYGDARDPLLLQVLPQAAELGEVPGFTRDAVGDLASRAAVGVLHKYPGRALLIASGSCAVHCRYCFRRHFGYSQDNAAANRWSDALDYLRNDSTIEEVILSGGDPLSLATPKLTELTEALADIAHIRRLRLHTRLPIVLPERVDSELLDWLGGLPWPVAVVLHANHANEIDGDVAAACAALRGAGVSLLNQSVLLRGVNDTVEDLVDLSQRLFDCGVLPYYLHQLDRVAGVAHFAIDDDRAKTLHTGVLQRVPGYLAPRLVREVAGELSKTPL
jgi:L-lysine 2,3-aminomutase